MNKQQLMESIPYNGQEQCGLYCEDCGWLACYFPESLPPGSVCGQCSHELGTSGACYNYETNTWNYNLVEE